VKQVASLFSFCDDGKRRSIHAFLSLIRGSDKEHGDLSKIRNIITTIMLGTNFLHSRNFCYS